MRQRLAKTKELFAEFASKYEAYCDAMDAANAAIDQYNTEARLYRIGYNERVAKVEEKLQELMQEMGEIDKQVAKARAGWTEAALNDRDVSGFDAEIEKQLTRIKVLQVKRQAIEEMKVPEDKEQLLKVKESYEAADRLERKAVEARSEAFNAAAPLVNDLDTNYSKTYSFNYALARIADDNSIEKIQELREGAANVKEAIDRSAEMRVKARKARLALMEQAKRFAETERRFRISDREKELINATHGRGDVEVDGKVFKRIDDGFSPLEFLCDGQSLREYLEQSMPLTDEDYRNGGFRPDGERY